MPVEGAVDVVIHPDPTTVDGDPINSKIIGIANKFKLIKETHNITILKFLRKWGHFAIYFCTRTMVSNLCVNSISKINRRRINR